ncbi:MAG: T9SS type A sorting domain-containing protein [Flavobacteriales bacterium]|nr:T9SS type A sorting domain-containing protein [Flavobacteriales bacterium]
MNRIRMFTLRSSLILLGLYMISPVMAQNSLIFGGGSGDGWTTATYAQSEENIFTGGYGDGWSSASYQQTEHIIFAGGYGDGWASDSIPGEIILALVETHPTWEINAWPNPVGSVLNVAVSGTVGKLTAEVLNAGGSSMGVYQYSNAQLFQVPIPETTGAYLIRLFTKEGATGSIRVIKN